MHEKRLVQTKYIISERSCFYLYIFSDRPTGVGFTGWKQFGGYGGRSV